MTESEDNLPDEDVDHSGEKLGKHPAEEDPRTLRFRKYKRDAADRPEIPPSETWATRVNENQHQRGQFHLSKHGRTIYEWGTMRNLKLNDCTVATGGHLIQAWTANASAEVTVSDEDVVEAYSAISGYDPQTGKPDRGASMLAALKHWRKAGIGDHRIDAFVALEKGDPEELREAIHLFGGAYIGLLLPISAQRQFVWRVVNDNSHGSTQRNSWEGHVVSAVAYTPAELTVITWGREKRMTWDFYTRYCDEAFGVLSRDWISATGRAPNHLDLSALQQDLARLSD